MDERAPLYGGQAVIEGVMMRGPQRVAIAVRRPDGQIALQNNAVHSVTERTPWLRLPILRGIVMLVETLVIGINALLYSANQAMGEEEKLSSKELTLTTVVGMAVAIGIFVALPAWVTALLRRSLAHHSNLLINVLEGLFRLALFIAYLGAISLMKDVERVFQYHGAEHKVINTWESGADLTVANVRQHSREHKRCGTSFLLYVVVLSILVFALMGRPPLWLRIPVQILLMPVIAGIGYELIRVLGRTNARWAWYVSRPGMWLQGLTTREPDDSQLEVAIVAFNGARGLEFAAD